MTMTELEQRCVDAGREARNRAMFTNDDISMSSIVRAVLAEAGVAELVEAARAVLPTLNCMRKQGIRVDPDQVDALEAALAKIGATQ